MQDLIYSNRFGRQYGLVHQGLVENLNILVVGDSEVLPYLLLNLAFCGVGSIQGGVYTAGMAERVEARHLTNQFLLRPEDRGEPLVEALSERLRCFAPNFDLQRWPEAAHQNVIPDIAVYLPRPGAQLEVVSRHMCRIYGQLLPAGIYVGHDHLAVEPFEENVFTPSLASLAGAILAQDVLRLSNAIRDFAITDQRIKISARIRASRLGRYFSKDAEQRAETDHGISARLKLGGEALRISSVSATENRDEGVFDIELPSESLLSRVLLDSIEIVEEPLIKSGGIRAPLLFSPLGNERIEDDRLLWERQDFPRELERLRAVVVGIGGLGTWLSGLFATIPSKATRMSLVDGDLQVEEHNLNRQVLFSDQDIGQPKVQAAQGALLDIRPDLDLRLYKLALSEEIVRYVSRGVSWNYEPMDGAPDDSADAPAGLDPRSKRLAMLSGDIQESDLVVSCLDNMRSRWILNCAASVSSTPFVNGGAGGFIGTVDLVEEDNGDASLITRYGEEIKHDTGKVQCGGGDHVLAIVTTNAAVASLQSFLSTAVVTGQMPEVNYIYFDGRSRDLWVQRFKERVPDDPLGIEGLLRYLEGGPGAAPEG